MACLSFNFVFQLRLSTESFDAGQKLALDSVSVTCFTPSLCWSVYSGRRSDGRCSAQVVTLSERMRPTGGHVFQAVEQGCFFINQQCGAEQCRVSIFFMTCAVHTHT